MSDGLKCLFREVAQKNAGLHLQPTDPRREARITVYYSCELQKLVMVYAVNISVSGLFIESADILPIGTTIVIAFALPTVNFHMSCRARVAWANEPGCLKKKSLPPGMGVEFLDLDLEKTCLIQEFLNKRGAPFGE